MKIQSTSNVLVLSKKELISRKDKTKKFYQIVFFNPATEELHKLFISKDNFERYEINNMYQVELLFVYDESNKTLSTYLQG